MKSNLPLTLLGAALLAVPAVFGQATSGVMGFSNLSCPPGTTIIVPTLVNSSVFQGQAAISSDGLTITPTTTPGWTAASFNATSFAAPTPNYPKYYAEIVSGASEGLILDVASNSTTSLTMASAVSPSSLRGTTVQIAIREHVTLDKMSLGSSGLSPYSDAVQIFNSNGSTSTRLFDGTSWLAEDISSAAGHTVIYPGTGIAITCVSNVTFTFMGEVKPTKTQIPLYVSSVNIVGPLNPASSAKLYGNTLVTALSPYADAVQSFSTDGSVTTTGTYLSDGSSMLDQNIVPLASNAPDAIPLNRGVTVTVGADTVWVVNSALTP